MQAELATQYQECVGGRECAVVRENTGKLQKDAGSEAMGYRSQEKIGSWSPDLAGHPAGNPLTCVVGIQSPGLRLKGTVRLLQLWPWEYACVSVEHRGSRVRPGNYRDRTGLQWPTEKADG